MKEWSVAKLNKENAGRISEEYGLPAIVAMLLDVRGLSDDIESFVSDEAFIDDPFEIKDMDKAVERIKLAIDNGEKICVYGDFDADGVSATALLYSYLETVGADVCYYIPERESEGYGMNKAAVDIINNMGVALIVTVDTGISAVEEIAYANSLGIDTVVTDHHVVGKTLPDAAAVVDLHRPDCNSRFKLISGVGVAFKLVMAIEGEYADVDMLLDNYADLVCIGTIGDIVELRDENRVFVKRGLMSINNGDRAGIRALCEASGYKDKPVNAGNISFTLVPRINAVGRLGQSKDSVSLLLTEDYEKALEIAHKLSDDNAERQRIERQILEEINTITARNPAIVQDRVIVIDGENWKKGVVGIVSSRVKEYYGKPCIVISRDGEEASGSGRSVEGFDLWEAVNSCSDTLTHFGGHTMACGLGLGSFDIEAFRERINEYAATVSMPVPKLKIDCKLNPLALSVDVAKSLYILEPYGSGNPSPVFMLSDLQITSIQPVKNNTHLRITFMKSGRYINAMKFKASTQTFAYKVGDKVDIAVSLDVNEYRGEESLSIFIRDIRFSDTDNLRYIKSQRLFDSFCKGEVLSREELVSIIPTRTMFAVVFRYLKGLKNRDNLHPEVILHELNDAVSMGQLRVIFEALNDLGVIAIYEDMKRLSVKMLDKGQKVNIPDAAIIKRLKEVYSNE